jgi:hypothetical protein
VQSKPPTPSPPAFAALNVHSARVSVRLDNLFRLYPDAPIALLISTCRPLAACPAHLFTSQGLLTVYFIDSISQTVLDVRSDAFYPPCNFDILLWIFRCVLVKPFHIDQKPHLRHLPQCSTRIQDYLHSLICVAPLVWFGIVE